MCYKLSPHERKIVSGYKRSHEPVCLYCGKHIEVGEVTVDHKVPRSRGGLTIEENLAMACYDCNHEKADMTDIEYIKYKRNLEQQDQVKELLQYFKQLKQQINNENRLKKLNRKNKCYHDTRYILEQQEKRMTEARKDNNGFKVRKDRYLEHMNDLFNQIQACN